MSAAVWYGDALRVMSHLPRQQWPEALAVLGYTLTGPSPTAADAEPRGASGGVRRGQTLATRRTESSTPLAELPLLARASSTAAVAAAASGGTFLPPEEPSARQPAPILALYDEPAGRGLVAAILRALHSSGSPDVAALVRRVARGVPAAPLPRRARLRLPARIVVAVDTADTMRAYDDDLRALFEAIELTVDAESVVRVAITDAVADIVEAVEIGLGDVVLLVTDLGIPRSASPERASIRTWITLAEALIDRGAQPIALVPYPPLRWPQPVVDVMPVAQWDRTADVATIRRTHERGRGR